jgi:type VI secretion system protein ImpE
VPTDSLRQIETGDLDGAIASLGADVKQHPTDTNKRALLAEVLCFAGNLERADKLLDLIEQQDSSISLGVALFRQLIRAEEARQQFYTECRLPEFIDRPTEVEQLYIKAIVATKDGDEATAVKLLQDAESARAPLSGTIDGQSFEDFRDLDDVAAAHFDVLTSTGKFFWVPTRLIEAIEFHPAQRRRDLLWRRATLEINGRPDGEVFIPTIYPFLGKPPGPLCCLGQETDFLGGDDSPVRGSGLRTFLVGEESMPIMDMTRIEFSAAK